MTLVRPAADAAAVAADVVAPPPPPPPAAAMMSRSITMQMVIDREDLFNGVPKTNQRKLMALSGKAILNEFKARTGVVHVMRSCKGLLYPPSEYNNIAETVRDYVEIYASAGPLLTVKDCRTHLPPGTKTNKRINAEAERLAIAAIEALPGRRMNRYLEKKKQTNMRLFLFKDLQLLIDSVLAAAAAPAAPPVAAYAAAPPAPAVVADAAAAAAPFAAVAAQAPVVAVAVAALQPRA
jgi:hypothetical protein